ncbi:MAG: tol-pal system protein YbgF [Alphaproteobacteria bacterium]
MTQRIEHLIRGALAAIASAIVLGVVTLVPATPAAAQQDMRALLERIDRLERDSTQIQRQLYRSGVPAGAAMPSAPASSPPPADLSGDTAGRLQQKVTDLESVLTGLTGQVEEARFQVGQVRSRLDKLVTDVDYRLQQIEQRLAASAQPETPQASGDAATPAPPARPGAGAATPAAKVGAGGNRQTQDTVAAFGRPGQDAATPPKAGGKAAAADDGNLPKGSPKEQYEYIQTLLAQANHAAAEKALAAFIDAHPDDPLAGNAQYWLGETFYVRGDYRNAAVAFAKGYQKYPKSAKAAANVLKLGMALAKLDRVQDACTALGRLASEFPNAPGDVKQKASQEKKTLGCK